MPVRLDYELLERYVPEGARVLDLGCGDGALLEELIRKKGCEGCGIDIDPNAVQQCIGRGVPVYHGDMLEGMSMFDEGSFDCVVLSQTLQQTLRPASVVQEMLRVGNTAIISFPNFGYWKIRAQLLVRGRRPRTEALHHPWYETPNIHLLTIKDFVDFCRDWEFAIADRIYLSPRYRKLPGLAANLCASMAIFVLAGAGARPS